MTRLVRIHARWLLCTVIVAALAGCATPDTRSGTATELSRAQATLQDFRNDPDMTWFRNHIKDARASDEGKLEWTVVGEGEIDYVGQFRAPQSRDGVRGTQ